MSSSYVDSDEASTDGAALALSHVGRGFSASGGAASAAPLVSVHGSGTWRALKSGMNDMVHTREYIEQTVARLSAGSAYDADAKRRDANLNSRLAATAARLAAAPAAAILRAGTALAARAARAYATALAEPERTWVCVDMDAFYAAVEERDDASLRGTAFAVGSLHGVISTSSYAARRYGVRSAQPTFIARALCPTLRLVPHNFPAYETAAQDARRVFATLDPDFHSMGLDEAILDVTDVLGPHRTTADISSLLDRLRADVFRETRGLTCSVGSGPSRLIAKIASNVAKPDGKLHVSRAESQTWLADLPARSLPGVGKVLNEQLRALGVENIGEILAQGSGKIAVGLGERLAHDLARMAVGLDSSNEAATGGRKGCSSERTFSPTSDFSILSEVVSSSVGDVCGRLKEEELVAALVTLKLKSHDFSLSSTSMPLSPPTSDLMKIQAAALSLLEASHGPRGAGGAAKDAPPLLRLLGVRVSSLTPALRGPTALDNFVRGGPAKRRREEDKDFGGASAAGGRGGPSVEASSTVIDLCGDTDDDGDDEDEEIAILVASQGADEPPPPPAPQQLMDVHGDVLVSKEPFLLHVCNCTSVSARGLTADIFSKWPSSDVYIRRRGVASTPGTFDVTRVSATRAVVALFAQRSPGAARAARGEDAAGRLLWFRSALDAFASKELLRAGVVRAVAMPAKIGCSADSGGDWEAYRRVVADWAQCWAVSVYIYDLNTASGPHDLTIVLTEDSPKKHSTLDSFVVRPM